MKDKSPSHLENELIETFLLAMKKGMTSEEFFSVADATLEHLRGGTQNPVLEKVLAGNATEEEVSRMVRSLLKDSPRKP